MSQSAERYYTFLSRDEALDAAPIDHLALPPEQRAILKEAHRRMVGFLTVATVAHLGYDGNLKEAQLVVHRDLVDSIQERFAFMCETGFALHQMRPQVAYGYDDARSMADNNTSCYRPDKLGVKSDGILKLSKHCVGAAVDIEPVHNKMRHRDGTVEPPHTPGYEERDASMIMYNLPLRQEFSDAGFEYGGTWPVAGIEVITGHPDHYPGAPADEHHFELRDQKLPEETHLIDMSELALPSGMVYEAGTVLTLF